MNQNKIQTIKLNSFRGATKTLQIDFDKKKSMVMIFGENGTGKSTIIDAIDFIFNKQCGSLKEKSSTNIKSHLPSLGSTSQDVEVCIKTNQGYGFKGKLDGSKPEIKGDSNLLLSVRILRRDKILKLINAEPKTRYEKLKDFIDLPNISSSENSLRESIRYINAKLNTKISNRQTQDKNLEQSWEQEGQPENDHLKWAKNISSKNTQELTENTINYEELIDLIEGFNNNWEKLEKKIKECNTSKKELETAKSNLQEQSKENQPEEIIDILTKTKSFLQKKKTAEECPACEQPIVFDDLQKRIVDRLNNMNNLVEASKKFEKAKDNYKFFQNKHSEIKISLKKSVKRLIDFCKEKNSVIETKKIIENFNKNNLLTEDQIDLNKTSLFVKDVQLSLRVLEESYEKDKKNLNQLNLIKTSFNSLQETEKYIQNLNNKKEYLDKILKIIEKERKNYVVNILTKISQDIEDLYLKLHPDEGLNNIQLLLNLKTQGSLEIKSTFQNKEGIPPQAYFSDSHLDTLGICVFIAMAKYFKNNILVLDDVVTSLDQQHLDRFIQMLEKESQNFNQIILTTHYRPWRDKYKFHRQHSSNIQFIELSTNWSIEQGIKSNQTKLLIEELEELKKKEPLDRQIVASKTSVFLENLLDHLTFIYKLKLPRRASPIYTLGELMNAFPKKFIKQIQIKKDNKTIILSDMINNLFQITNPIRNQVGCHFNEKGSDISDKEVHSFLNKTIELGKTLICDQCKELPQRKQTNCWKCNCGKISLYPIEKGR